MNKIPMCAEKSSTEFTSEMPYPGWIKFLPAIYHQYAEIPGNPLYALLVIMEKSFSKFEKDIYELEKYFDAQTTPITETGDFLDWLSSWVGLELDDACPEAKRRFLIKKAAKLYKLRGTLVGLTYAIEQYFGLEVETEEWAWPPGMVIGQTSSLGLTTQLMDRGAGNCFVVKCHCPHLPKDMEKEALIRKVRNVIDLIKPAHTKYYLELTISGMQEEKKEVENIQSMIIELNSQIGFCYQG